MKDIMKKKNKNRKKVDEAWKKIGELRAMGERLRSRNSQGTPSSRNAAIQLVSDIEQKAVSLMLKAQEVARELDIAGRMITPRKGGSRRGLGILIGGLGSSLVSGAGSILDSAIPITKSVIGTSKTLVDAVSSTALSTASTITKVGTSTASSLLSTAQSASQSMIGQTANLATSLTQNVTKQIGGILGAGTDVAKSTVSSILNSTKSGVSGLSKMVGSTADAAQGILSSAGQTSQSLLTTATNAATSLTSSATSMASSMASSVTSFAGDLCGEAGSFLSNSIFGGSGDGGMVGTIGGLFGSAAEAATSIGGDAISAATGLVGDMASGLGDLSSNLLSSASDMASQMVDAGLDVAGSMLDAAADIGGDILDAVSDVADAAIDTAADIGGEFVEAIGDVASSALDVLSRDDAEQDEIDAEQEMLERLDDFADEMERDEDEDDEDDDGEGQEPQDEHDYPDADEPEDSEYGDGEPPYPEEGEEGDFADRMYDAAEQMERNIGEIGQEMMGDMVDSVAGDVDGMLDQTQNDIQDTIGSIDDGMDEMREKYEAMRDDWNPEGWDTSWTGENPPDSSESEINGQNDEDEGQEPDFGPEGYAPEPENHEWNQELGPKPDAAKISSTTIPLNPPIDPPLESAMVQKADRTRKLGWRRFPHEAIAGIMNTMREGDQQFLNPYGEPNGDWTLYSFRPQDTIDSEDPFPQIAITPASFESISSMDAMLDMIPYVVVKEYFFKNTTGTMVDFIKKVLAMSKETKDKVKQLDDKQSDQDEASSSTVDTVKDNGKKMMDLIKEKFSQITLENMAIDIPYILYNGLKKKMYGNTYIFPYIVENGTIINQANNQQEWDKNGAGGILGLFKGLFQNVAGFIGGAASLLSGSNAQTADLFPAPTWSIPKNADGASFTLKFALINDNAVKTRNNYMCANTIINNNRYIQKAMLAFPGALYELWLPTGQRHLMCTADIQLSPLGLNRILPDNFFGPNPKLGGQDSKAANFTIGVNLGNVALMKNPHSEDAEVIPDAYQLNITFKSCLANNLNNSVFQYYVKMAGYGEYSTAKTGGSQNDDSAYDATIKQLNKAFGTAQPSTTTPAQNVQGGTNPPGSPQNANGSKEFVDSHEVVDFHDAVDGLLARLDDDGEVTEQSIAEKFEEATYNKRIGRMDAAHGDEGIESDSVVDTIRRAQATISESNRLLSRLYNAPRSRLWYRTFPDEELDTSLEKDARRKLRAEYGRHLQAVRRADSQMEKSRQEMDAISEELSSKPSLDEREEAMERKVQVVKRLSTLQKQKDEHVDAALAIDTQLIQKAYDEHDKVVGVGRKDVSMRSLSQLWNEKIMNQYERDRMQYLTSTEKTRYFKDKVRELRKVDPRGVLNHPEWFFRIAVIDAVVEEMSRLIYWFKNCSYDDFDTIYRIVRKIRLLQLDIDAAYGDDAFDINTTNLFHISSEDMEQFTSIDGLLDGSDGITLYQLFQSQVRMNFSTPLSESRTSTPVKAVDKELAREQESEIDMNNRREIRDDIVVRIWGSEANLTQEAYRLSSEDSELREVKNRIMELKTIGSDRQTQAEKDELMDLLGQLTNRISAIKENLVMMAIDRMGRLAKKVDSMKDGSTNARTISEIN